MSEINKTERKRTGQRSNEIRVVLWERQQDRQIIRQTNQTTEKQFPN